MSFSRISLLTVSTLFLVAASPQKPSLDISRLSPSQTVEIIQNGSKSKIVLNANDKTKPLLNTNIKKSIRIVNNDAERKEFLAQGVSIDAIRAMFAKHGFKTQGRFFDDFTIVKNFIHGVKEYKSEDILKTKMNDQDHHSYYWYAIIPKNVTVIHAYAQRDWFDSGVGTHGQLRFIINAPLVLVPQDLGVMESKDIADMTGDHWKTQFLAGQKSPIAIAGDLVYSLFALRYAGGPTDWSFMTGIGGAFANAYTLSSVSHNVIYLATTDYVEQHSLKDPQTLGTRTLQAVLERSNNFQEKNIYHLIFNSCITELNAALSSKGSYLKKSAAVSFNSYRFIEQMVSIFNNPVGADQSLNAEFDTIVREKTVHPKVVEFKSVVTSQELDNKIAGIAMQLAPLTYKELIQIMTAVKAAQASPATNDPMLTVQSLLQILKEKNVALPAMLGGLDQQQQSMIILGLLKDPRIMQTFEMLKQRL